VRIALATRAGEVAMCAAACRRVPPGEVLSSELAPLLAALRFLEREASALLAPRKLGWRGRPFWLASTRIEVHREPAGLLLIVGPSNYPLFLPGVQVVQGLAAGNAVWVKPAPGCSAPMNRLRGLLLEAGLPAALLTVLPENVQTVDDALASGVDKVLFTGSGDHGRDLLARAATHVVPATVELSGMDPVIVCDDANVDLVVRALRFGLSLNRGRTCIAPRRVYGRPAVLREVERGLAATLQPGAHKDGPAGGMGPLLPLLTEAFDHGARLVAGGVEEDGTPTLPMVLAGVVPGVRLLSQEFFLPLIALVEVESEARAIEEANASPFALGASVFTRDVRRGQRLAESLRAGVVTINDLIVPSADPRIPFGGRGASGFGVTRGPEGLLDLTVPKVITRTRGRFRPAFDPAHPGDEALWTAALRLGHGGGAGNRAFALLQLLRELLRRKRRPR
jgi:acyl-CoA reductase-like NAD-dependent aldehyde dehydrogenase